ncbi:MAG TPA: hypothetical protein VJY54_03635 [Lachnospiraceae bacterium]|nr:hypothetical protein [Lachnospiraceae bacterium]
MNNKYKKMIIIPCLLITLVGVITFVYFKIRPQVSEATVPSGVAEQKSLPEDSNEEPNQIESDREKVVISLTIEDYYITNTGYPSNLYYVDENNILWGCGRNDYGQLGQGTQDYDFHGEMVKIAENVVHVDYSQKGFTIYLTKDHKLYGFGNAGCGALQQLSEFSRDQYINDEHYTTEEPVLLMEDVAYARCGQSDIACLKTDSSVWIWGTVWYEESQFYYEKEPVKVLEDAVLVTGGWFNHAALLRDGSVWTWGHNYSGNCGIEGEAVISVPQKAAEDVMMVWTGSTKNNVDCYDISAFEGIYERSLENTIIQKTDGSYWICGANVGEEEKVIPLYYETSNFSMICTHEFLPYDKIDTSME